MKQYELFWDVLEATAAKQPDHPAVVCRDRAFTYAQLKHAAELFASDLVKMGVRQGDHVALWAANCINWPVAYFGILRAGGVAVLFNHGLMLEDIAKQMVFTDVKFIAYGTVRANLDDPDNVEKIASLIGIPSVHIYDIRRNFHVRMEENETVHDLPEINRDSTITSTIIFSSGSTAKPKAVLQSQRAYCQNIYSCIDRLNTARGLRACPALPLFHCFGLYVLMSYLFDARTVYLVEKLDPNIITETIIAHQVSDLYSVAAIYLGMMQHPRFQAEVSPLLRFCDIGGSKIPPEQIKKIADSFPNANSFYGYGQTEACMVISIHHESDGEEKLMYTVGRPLSSMDVRIMDSNRDFLPAGKNGEIVYRCDAMMNGYYKMPQKQQAIDDAGWLHTGDLGHFDDEGFLYITGRLKDIIIKSGENVVPSEIEGKILACEGIREVKVLGAPHPIVGESIEACIIPEPGAWRGEDVLREQLKGKLNSFMTPSHFFVYDQFPLNENGKLDQRTLQKDVIDRIKHLTASES